jgi:hypothetical protein
MKRMARKRKFLNFFLLMLILGTCVYVVFGKESKIQDFPVPFLAKYQDDDNPKDLKYSTSGVFYSLTLRLNGWKENYHEGELKSFGKNNKEVLVFLPTGENAIYLYESKK